MEDSIDVGDIEDIIYACTEETEQRGVDNKEEGEKERRSLVRAGDEADHHHHQVHETKTTKNGGDHQLTIDDGERKDEVEKEGGLTLINQVIFNLMSPTEDREAAERQATDGKMDQENDDKIQGDTESQGSSNTEEEFEFEFDREGQEQEEKVKVSDEQAKSEAGSGGSGIVDSIISSLPASLSLSSEDATPDTDEASFLIHSIVHD